jgi:hypothetical protein
MCVRTHSCDRRKEAKGKIDTISNKDYYPLQDIHLEETSHTLKL